MSIWDKFKAKKEKKAVDDISTPEFMEEYRKSGDEVLDKYGKTRCFMCIMMGTHNPVTWRFIDKVYCDEHKEFMDQMLRKKQPGKEPPWERI